MFNLTVPHFQDSKQSRAPHNEILYMYYQIAKEGPPDHWIGPPLHLQIGPSRGGQLARLSCLKQLQGKITDFVLFVISFPISLLTSLRIADKQKSRSSHGI